MKRQPKKKEKKAKELTNGSLEDKPNNKHQTETVDEISDDDVVIIETEEE